MNDVNTNNSKAFRPTYSLSNFCQVDWELSDFIQVYVIGCDHISSAARPN